MKKIINILFGVFSLLLFFSCEPQTDSVSKEIGAAPKDAKITVSTPNAWNPVFKASAANGFVYHWDMGNGQTIVPDDANKGNTSGVTAYYPFKGTYTVTCTIYGAGAQKTEAATTFTVAQNDPDIATKPVWKELTGGGTGRTWIYNTDPDTGSPDYCYQTTGDLATYPDNWMPSASWGQCILLTPDIHGEMIFDLNGGINYTYHHVAGDAGVKGTFVLNTAAMTITIKNPYILDHNIDCTQAAATATGVYQVKKLTDDEMVLWQNQGDGTGWGWSFKKKE